MKSDFSTHLFKLVQMKRYAKRIIEPYIYWIKA
jgi:hypothetical protein